MASPTVSKSIDKGVTSKNSRFCTCDDPSPMRMAACTAAVTRPWVSRGCTLAPNHWSRTRSSAAAGAAAVAAAAAAAAVLHLLQWLSRFRCSGSGRQRAVCCFLFSPFSPRCPLLPLLPFLTLRTCAVSCTSRAALVAARHARQRQSRRPQVWSVVHLGLLHAFRHHVLGLFDTTLSSYIRIHFLLSFNAILSRCHLFFSIVPFLSTRLLFLLFAPPRAFPSLM